MNNYIAKIREQFPYLSSLKDKSGRPLVYMDSAATAQKPRSVMDYAARALCEANANVHRGVYDTAVLATQEYEAAREAVRRFLNASKVEEIVFTSGTTASINLLANVYAEKYFQDGDEILISEGEHHSNMVPWQRLSSRYGVKLRYISVEEDGQWNMQEAETILKEGRVKMVSVAHVSNVLGVVNPVQEITALSHRYGARVHVDGAQGIVHRDVDVQRLGCDFYSFSGHKLFALTGTGVLYGRKDIMETLPPWMGGGEMVETVTYESATFAPLPLKFEAGTPNFIAQATLRPAIEFVTSIRSAEIDEYEKDMMLFLTQELKKIPDIRIYGSGGEKAPLFSFSVKGVHHSDIAMLLDKMNIAVRSGLMCSEPLINKFGQTGLVRVSLGPYNTIEECEYFITSLKRVINMLS